MLEHRFGLGAIVRFRPSYRWLPRDDYEVVRLLPAGGDSDLQYRLKSRHGSEERVASEAWLREAFAGLS
jgi:hypothetical protein